MSNIIVKNQGAALPSRARDPFEWMRRYWSWDPFGEMRPASWLSDDLESFVPAFDVKETSEGYVFKADLPGVKAEDVEVTMTGSILTVKGSRKSEKEEKTDTYHTIERSSGSFVRSFTLPAGVDPDKVHADLKEGVLTLLVPKKPEVQPKKIAVK